MMPVLANSPRPRQSNQTTGSTSPSTPPPPQPPKCKPPPRISLLSHHPLSPGHPSTRLTTTRTIVNLSQGHSYTITITNGPVLARVNADWVVERPYYGGTLVSFPTFTDVWFDEAWATRTSGSMGILGAKQFQIQGLCASQEWDDTHQVSWSV